MQSSSTIPETGPELLTLPQVAALCGVSQRTVMGLGDGRHFPAPAENRQGHGSLFAARL